VAGKIVPVEISLSLLKAAMESAPIKKGLFLVDGFPRNFDNLSGWCRVMSDVAALESVLVYQCPLSVLQERILERAKVSGRSDDNIESVQKRFRTFESETVPVQKRFRTFESETVPVVDVLRSISQDCPLEQQRWSVIDIAADRPLDDVWSSTQKVLQQLIISDVLTANAALLNAIETNDVPLYLRLSDPAFFVGKDVATVMHQQEGKSESAQIIQNAEIEVITGRQVSVSYDRRLNDALIREKRFWSYEASVGWRNVHFVRTPTDPLVA
jgi:adenylate kinase family enzyme